MALEMSPNKYARAAHYHLDAKKKIVEAGNSRKLKEWQKYSTVTKEEFLDALEWLCDDPLNQWHRPTREVGLTPTGLVKLKHCYYDDGSFEGFADPNGRRWCGALFHTPARNEFERLNMADENGLVRSLQQISISALDQV
jgi:hypothetical protein